MELDSYRPGGWMRWQSGRRGPCRCVFTTDARAGSSPLAIRLNLDIIAVVYK
jgi:hypothetical protein